MIDIETQKLLYTYWSEIPFIMEGDSDKIMEMINSPVRMFILTKIRDGVEDDFSREHNLRRRHAFTIRELYDAYTKGMTESEKPSIQNFHFHANKLEASGYIKVIVKILEGRHYMTYYGRTAKIFDNLTEKSLHQDVINNQINPLKVLVEHLNPEAKSEISELFDQYHHQVVDQYLRVYSWVKDHYDYFYDSGINIRSFIFNSVNFSHYNSALHETTRKIAELLDFHNIMEYPHYTPKEALDT